MTERDRENAALVEPDPERPGAKIIVMPGVEAPRAEADPALDHFRPLGFFRDRLYFLTRRGKQILCFELGALTGKTLLALAPLQWWEMEFPSKTGWTGQAVLRAVDFLMRTCYAQGVFRPDQVRGRGCWYDDGCLVIHTGDGLLIDGQSRTLDDITSRYVYEAQPPVRVAIEDPMTAGEARALFDYCTALAWEEGKLPGILLAGWVACAIACGALRWRPHIFLTGGSGTGKSTVLDVVKRVLGDFALACKEDTTAPGIRQIMGPDALPVIFDEAESETVRAEQNMQSVLALARASSSDGDGKVAKGGASGQAVAYAMRSMFLFAGVRVPLKQTADLSRVSVLALRKPSAADRERYVADLIPIAAQLVDPAWASRFRARVFAHVGALRDNAAVFAGAAADHLGSGRQGDQVGPLLAGAYLLHRDGLVSPAAAREWVQAQVWDEQAIPADDCDEHRLMAAIMECPVSLMVDRTRYDASIGELVGLASGRVYHRAITPTDAAGELGRRGIRTSTTHVLVSNTHREIGRMLAGTPYASGWPRILRRIEGAVAQPPVWFGGAKSRGTAIPLDLCVTPGGAGPPS